MKQKIQFLKESVIVNPTQNKRPIYSKEFSLGLAYGQLVGRYEMAGLGLEVIKVLKKKNQELRKHLKQLSQ